MWAEIVDFIEAVLAQAVATCGDFTVQRRYSGRPVRGSADTEPVSWYTAGEAQCRLYNRPNSGGHRNGRKPRRAW